MIDIEIISPRHGEESTGGTTARRGVGRAAGRYD